MQVVVTQRLIYSMVRMVNNTVIDRSSVCSFGETPVVGRDTTIPAREAENEPPIFGAVINYEPPLLVIM